MPKHCAYALCLSTVPRRLLQREVIEHGEGSRAHLDHLSEGGREESEPLQVSRVQL
jgi:hypothetical protein